MSRELFLLVMLASLSFAAGVLLGAILFGGGGVTPPDTDHDG